MATGKALPYIPQPSVSITLAEVDRVAGIMGAQGIVPLEPIKKALEVASPGSLAAAKSFKEFMLGLRAPLHVSGGLAFALQTISSSPIESCARVLYAHTQVILSDDASEHDEQLRDLLSTTRMVGPKEDTLSAHHKSRHAVVWCNGQAFQVEVVDSQGQAVSITNLKLALKSIQVDAASLDAPNPVARLSWTLSRSDWNKSRQYLKYSPASNAEAFTALESATVTVAMENHASPTSMSERLYSTQHGLLPGSQRQFSSNRYADQTLGLVVYTDGEIDAWFDHAVADGLVAGNLAGTLATLAIAAPVNNDSVQFIKPARLQIDATGVAAYDIPQLLPALRATHQVQLGAGTSRRVMKTLQDTNMLTAAISMAVQHAIFAIRGNDRNLLIEPVDMRHFAGERCHPAYTVTDESISLMEILAHGTPDVNARVDAVAGFAKALLARKAVIKNAKQGQSVGLHIAALRKILNALPESDSDVQAALRTVNLFSGEDAPLIYVTGFDERGVQGAMSNTYAGDHLACCYTFQCGDELAVNLNLNATGAFVEITAKLGEGIANAFEKIAEIAATYATLLEVFQDASDATLLVKALNRHHDSNISDELYSLALHGGAGEHWINDASFLRQIENVLFVIAEAGKIALSQGQAALDVAEMIVSFLENCYMFNAGKGSVFNDDGEHELEACIVDGETKRSGAVACVRQTKNPIRAARKVMAGRHALLVGAAVDKLAAESGLDVVDNAYFSIPERKAVWESVRQTKCQELTKHPQTVGAVVRDRAGRLCAAASTGGIVNKLVGRVGDVAVPGAGIYADRDIAVICSGDGDAFLRNSVAAAAAKAYGEEGKCMETALSAALDLVSRDGDAQGGIISLNRRGEVMIKANCKLFFVASATSNADSSAQVLITQEHILPQYTFHSNENMAVGVAHCPSVQGQVTATLSGEKFVDLFSMDKQAFVKAMSQLRTHVQVLQQVQAVQRCALVTSGAEAIHILPLHGLGKNWAPVTTNESAFFEKCPGYVSSKNGPRASNESLLSVQRTITAQSGLAAPYDTTFYGDADDNNLFARIVRGELEQWRVWENATHVAFLTPFGNTSGFTVLVPRKHLDSDIFGLESEEYKLLMGAAHEVSAVLKSALGCSHVGMIFEGYEINYAHVKLIPRQSASTAHSLDTVPGEFYETYPGFVSSQVGPRAAPSELVELTATLRAETTKTFARTVSAPQTWRDPLTHHIRAIQSDWYRHVFQLQDTLFHETVKFFSSELAYKYALVPITTDCISSPMGLGSDSLPVSIDLLGQRTYLADSMQFTLEYMVRMSEGLAGSYYIAPSFRGEDPDESHLNQFYHVECELLGTVDDAIETAEKYVYHLIKNFRRKNAQSINAMCGTTQHLDAMLALMDRQGGKFKRITVDDAIAILPSEDCWELAVEGHPELGRKLTRKGERFLIQKFGGACWLTEFDHLSCPFYQAYVDGTKKKARCADLLIGLGETLGLGERHATAEEAMEALDQHEVPHESYAWYLDIRREKALKTSGWGMGSERLLCWLVGHDDVRDFGIIPRMKGATYLP